MTTFRILYITDGQTFIWTWTKAEHANTLRTVASFAADADIPFSWFDAAKVTQAMRHLYEKFATEGKADANRHD